MAVRFREEMTMASSYAATYAQWRGNPSGFWSEAAAGIDWSVAPSVAFDGTRGVYGHWFPDGETNACYNCVDRHVEAGRGEQAALIYDSPVTGQVASFTYRDVLAEVQAIAAAGLDPSYLQWNSRWGAQLAFRRLPRTTDEQTLHGLEYQWFAVLQSRLLTALSGPMEGPA